MIHSSWIFRRRQREKDLDEEVQSHLGMAAQERIEQGETAEQAHASAVREFGNVTLVKEVTRDMWGLRGLENLLQDLRYGLRAMLRNPGFTIVALLTLALGIGVNTAIVSVVNAVLIRPLPYRDPGRLVYISEFWPRETPFRTVPNPDFANWSDHDRLFDGLAAYGGAAEVNLTSLGEPERILGAKVTWDFFPLLGVQPSLGRGFLREEDQPGGRQVVLLSHELWQRRFGSDPSVVGSSVNLDGAPHTIVGVIPAGFRFPDDEFKAELFLPIILARIANWSSRAPENFRLLRPLARLKPGVTVDNVRAELSGLVQQTAGQEPPQFIRMRAGMEVRVTPLRERLAAPARPILLVLLCSVGLLLIMSCVNVASLQLARGAAEGTCCASCPGRSQAAHRGAIADGKFGAGDGRCAPSASGGIHRSQGSSGPCTTSDSTLGERPPGPHRAAFYVDRCHVDRHPIRTLSGDIVIEGKP
jgi:putative ABC transport system permease protein